MKDVKVPTSRSYHEHLIESLKDSEHAAAYIAVMLELDEDGYDPKIFRSALANVIQSPTQSGNLSETAKQHHEKLDSLLAETGGEEIVALIELLNPLGYKIAIAFKD
jgi:DNA-binding phage protein